MNSEYFESAARIWARRHGFTWRDRLRVDLLAAAAYVIRCIEHYAEAPPREPHTWDPVNLFESMWNHIDLIRPIDTATEQNIMRIGIELGFLMPAAPSITSYPIADAMPPCNWLARWLNPEVEKPITPEQAEQLAVKSQTEYGI